MKVARIVAATVAWLLCACSSPPTISEPPAGPSNIYARDYVGPDTCGDCHPAKFETWQTSLHAGMTADVNGELVQVRGDFSKARLNYAGGSAQFDSDGLHLTMTLSSATGVLRRYRVTRTIGSRALQEYVGVLTQGPEPVGSPVYQTEIRLPFGVWLRTGRWLPQSYFDSWFGAEYTASGAPAVDAFTPDPAPWASRCAWCHNTYPLELRLIRDLSHPRGYGHEQNVALSSSTRNAAATQQIGELNMLPTSELVSVGISCESCHLGGREHADNGEPISFQPVSRALQRRVDGPAPTAGREDPKVIAATCGQCHSTPAATFPSGAVARNSSESLDMAAGFCSSAIRCIDCHDPHIVSTDDRYELEEKSMAACVSCHPALASAESQLAHTGHDSAAATCLDCHMPRMVQGVGGMVLSHRISSPDEPRMLAAAAPNACNLCHLEESIDWTLSQLETTFGSRLSVSAPSVFAAAYSGKLNENVGALWLASANRNTRLAAAGAYGRKPGTPIERAQNLLALIAVLDQPIAYERMWTLFAVEELVGRKLTLGEYDPLAPPTVRARQVVLLPLTLHPSL